jgi:hypothetical protein
MRLARSMVLALAASAALAGMPLPCAAQPETLASRAAAIERASTAPDGFRVVVGHLSRELGVPVDALRMQRLRSGLDWGGIFIANRLAKETGLTFDEVLAAYRGGKSWEAIVREHNVDLAKLTAAVQRSQQVVERRAEDKAPPPMEWKSNAAPGTGTGGFVPGLMPSPITTPGRSQ